jgi:pantoate--beta-alanine ligase
MTIVRTVAELRSTLAPHRHGSRIARIGLVPTMGALHAGHVALFDAARKAADVVVASIFVNPTQFGDPQDYSAYPKDEAKDAKVASAAGVDVIFAPSVEELYPAGFSTWVNVEGPAIGLEGESRPGHFRGVATVCVKLFAAVEPHLAFFGQKDAQQVAVIKQVVRDLNLDLEIHVVPIVRDADGLALSSRNARLTNDDRLKALALPRALEAGLAAYRRQEDPISAARAVLNGLDVDYVAVADFDGQPTLAIAARAGRTRLIDNVVLKA